jgi:cobalamin-dependent methionine synthase I
MKAEPTFLHDIQIQISREILLRLLGAGTGAAQIRGDTLRMIEKAEELSENLLHPQGIYQILQNPQLEGLDYLRDHQLTGLALCTIGPELENKVRELMATGQEPEGYVLDAVGSVAAEATADVINAKICHWAAAHDLGATPRFSPGYGDWSLEEQRVIFRLLPAEKIGMRLNPSCMMIPRKSVSFAVIFQKKDQAQKITSPCERCGLDNCPFRKT